MKQFLMLYKGPATPPDASHAGWPEWFSAAGEALADRGSAMINGLSMTKDGQPGPSGLGVNGYGILQGNSLEELQPLITTHPYLQLGSGYSIEVFELPSK